MARRKMFFKKARRFAKKAYRSASKSQPSLLTSALYGAGYGAVRPYAANLIKPVTQMIPLGSLSDEVGMSLLAFAAAKWGSGMIRNVGRTALIVESASIGAQVSTGMVGSTQNTATNMQFNI